MARSNVTYSARAFRLGWAILATVALLLPACGTGDAEESAPVSGSWSDIVEAAEEEGSVTIYSSQVTDQLQNLELGFELKYPKIDLKFVRGAADEGVSKIEAEHRSGKGIGDVLVTASLPWVVESTDMFVPPEGPDFDAMAYGRGTNVPEGTYFVVGAFVGAFAWNTDLYSGTINDFPDVLDPSLNGGQIGVISPDSSSRIDFYNYLEENYGDDFLEKLADQEPRIYPSALPMAAALTSGEIAVATFVEPQTDEQEAGAPVEWGLAQPSWGARFYGMVVDTAPHPNAAQLLANFMITEAGQRAIARDAASVLPNITGAVTTTDTVSEQDAEALSTEAQQEFQAEWEDLFQS
jgi:iron(III) transport system substrate-binding protein